MTGRYIGVGLTGGLGFLLVYFIGKNFLVAVIAGFIILAVAYTIFGPQSEKQTKKITFDAQGDYQSLLEQGYKYTANFRTYSHELEKDPLAANLNILIDYLEKILLSIQNNPGNHRTLEELVNVYLPSLNKIINRYGETQKHGLEGREAKVYVEKTRTFLDELSSVFSKILDEVHDDDIFKATVEMDTMKLLMQSNGYMELDGFHIPEEGETHEGK